MTWHTSSNASILLRLSCWIAASSAVATVAVQASSLTGMTRGKDSCYNRLCMCGNWNSQVLGGRKKKGQLCSLLLNIVSELYRQFAKFYMNTFLKVDTCMHAVVTCIFFYICDPLQQNQEQVLFFINLVIGFIRRYRLLAII